MSSRKLRRVRRRAPTEYHGRISGIEGGGLALRVLLPDGSLHMGAGIYATHPASFQVFLPNGRGKVATGKVPCTIPPDGTPCPHGYRSSHVTDLGAPWGEA